MSGSEEVMIVAVLEVHKIDLDLSVERKWTHRGLSIIREWRNCGLSVVCEEIIVYL
jgi:hypothetical protein